MPENEDVTPGHEDLERPVLSDEEAGEVAGSGHGTASAWAGTQSGAGTAVESNCQRCTSCAQSFRWEQQACNG